MGRRAALEELFCRLGSWLEGQSSFRGLGNTQRDSLKYRATTTVDSKEHKELLVGKYQCGGGGRA